MPAFYAFTLASQSLRKDKWINLLSMLTIFAGLFILSIIFFIFYNIEAATRNLPEKFSMVVYLEDNFPRERLDQVISSIRARKAVSSVKFVSREDAFKELRSTLKNSQYVLEGLEENPLPDSLIVKLKNTAMGAESVRQLAEEVSRTSGISEVDYGEKFLATLHNVKAGMKITGIILTVVLCTGIVFVCYSTVKILFFRRNEEIETFKLLGATKGFIRAPFIIEGAAIGAAGGLAGLAAVFLLYHVIVVRLAVSAPIFNTLLFPSGAFMLLPLIGMFLGISGAAIALGRLRY
jgi:cell division transport system permease protein